MCCCSLISCALLLLGLHVAFADLLVQSTIIHESTMNDGMGWLVGRGLIGQASKMFFRQLWLLIPSNCRRKQEGGWWAIKNNPIGRGL